MGKYTNENQVKCQTQMVKKWGNIRMKIETKMVKNGEIQE